MKRVELVAAQLTEKETLHDVLAKELSLPEWYGRNLDALYDCLTELRDVELVLIGWPDEGYLARVRRVMVDAAWDNEHLSLIIID